MRGRLSFNPDSSLQGMTKANQTEQLEATVHGRVQGVGFRAFTIREAHKLDLMGWVRNEPDGTVRVVAEGPREALEQLLQALHRGPRSAHVTRVTDSWNEASGTLGPFEVRYR